MNENTDLLERMDDDEIEINLMEVLMIVLQKLPIILAFTVAAMVIAGAVTKFAIAPKYKATATLYVVSASNNSVVNLSDLQIGTNLTADYKTLILSRPMMERSIRRLGLEDEMEPRDLAKMIEIANPSGTRILTITVTSTNPELAADAANEVASQAVAWLPEVMAANAPNIAETAVVPTRKSGPSTPKNTVIAGGLMFMLCCGAILVQYVMNDAVTTPEDMEKYFGITPLASIPEDSGVKDHASASKSFAKKRGRKAVK